MFANDPKFLPWTDPAWDQWRDRESTSTHLTKKFCKTCGFTHNPNNHAPGIEVKTSELLDPPDPFNR